jgi:uncharacterized protein DUF6458
MGFATSLILIAIGAILAFAVQADVEGFDLDAVGIILMVVGVIGMIASIVYWSSWGGFRGGYGRRRRVIDEPF